MKLSNFDLSFCIQRLPRPLYNLMVTKEWHNRIFISGGYIRSVITQEKINDIDIFCKTKDDCIAVAAKLTPKDWNNFVTDNAITIRTKPAMQVITRWEFENPDDVALSFDFTICCAAIWHSSDRFDSFCIPEFYQDLAAKRLIYRRPVRNEDAGGTLLRVLKYYQRGYRIPLDSLAAVLARLTNYIDPEKMLNKEKGPQRENELQGLFTALLYEVDPAAQLSTAAFLPKEANFPPPPPPEDLIPPPTEEELKYLEELKRKPIDFNDLI